MMMTMMLVMMCLGGHGGSVATQPWHCWAAFHRDGGRALALNTNNNKPPPATITSTTTPTGKRKQTRGATTLKSIHDFKFWEWRDNMEKSSMSPYIYIYEKSILWKCWSSVCSIYKVTILSAKRSLTLLLFDHCTGEEPVWNAFG